MEVGSGEDGEACCCPPVVTVPLTMVHFSEKGGLEGGGGELLPQPALALMMRQFQVKVRLMEIKQEVEWGGVGSERSEEL